ncbi:hypothetical protein ACIRJR_10295 [Streptomyces sp. NPDC102402]
MSIIIEFFAAPDDVSAASALRAGWGERNQTFADKPCKTVAIKLNKG